MGPMYVYVQRALPRPVRGVAGRQGQHERARVLVLAVSLMAFLSCAGQRPTDLGVAEGRLRACPDSPNCVSTAAVDAVHRIAPFDLAVAPAVAWPAVQAAVAEIPRCRIVTVTSDYLHAEVRSAVFGFVDDLEVYLPAGGITLMVRSASRLGYSDFGVNRRRVEALRAALLERGVIRGRRGQGTAPYGDAASAR
jgi:uncharacterized protein (DUF1499 family)